MRLRIQTRDFRFRAESKGFCKFASLLVPMLFAAALLGTPSRAWGQVSSQEILNPRAKALEKAYLPRLIAFNHAIQSLQFPFPFHLRRYVGLNSKDDPAPDTRGLQFLKFHNQIILKISGDYGAAFNANLLTRNQRAAKAFEDVAVPILQILPQEIPANADCNGVGLEISYHVRSRDQSFDYEGAEDLVVILSKKDAFAFSKLSGKPEWQEALNRSQAYIDKQQFGLALGEREPIPLEALDDSPKDDTMPSSVVKAETPAADTDNRLASLDRQLGLGPRISEPGIGDATPRAVPAAIPAPAAPNLAPRPALPAPQTQSDVARLQTRYQSQLDAIAKEDAAGLHFVSYAPPTFVLFQNRVYLQLTLRNPHLFDAQTSSIYKRAAQSFDLFLAPQLKALLAHVPQDASLAGLDVTVLNELGPGPKTSSEAAEFICPIGPLRQFADAGITNQDLIDQSIVLMNGVRIALNLQQVE
jgi:hypothetical protein